MRIKLQSFYRDQWMDSVHDSTYYSYHLYVAMMENSKWRNQNWGERKCK